MHADEIHSDESVAQRLIAAQAPQWADLPIRRFASGGTDNAIYRIGDALALRLPRRQSSMRLLRKELDWLPTFGELPLAVPRLRLRGRADLGVTCDFGIFDWVEGDIASPENIADPKQAARDLAGFLKALHLQETASAPPAGEDNKQRGVALDLLTPLTSTAIDVLADEIDAPAAHALWRSASAILHPGKPVWLHGDLKADNLIVANGRLRAVIDWGLAGVGDPAADYATAWSWVDPAARDDFRQALAIGDEDWLRGKGWALYGAIIALSYYRGGKNEALSRQSRLTLNRLGLN